MADNPIIDRWIDEYLSNEFEPLGIEGKLFLVDWYNDLVNQVYRIEEKAGTLAMCLIANRYMFDDFFLPSVFEELSKGKSIDEMEGETLIDDKIKNMIKCILNEAIRNSNRHILYEIIMDSDFHPTTTVPKLAISTCAYVSGHADYLRPEESAGLGLAVHPLYGGHFSIKAVIVFKNIQIFNLSKKTVSLNLNLDVKNQLIKEYNEKWFERDWRDKFCTDEKFCYSDRALEYFRATYEERIYLLKKWYSNEV